MTSKTTGSSSTTTMMVLKISTVFLSFFFLIYLAVVESGAFFYDSGYTCPVLISRFPPQQVSGWPEKKLVVTTVEGEPLPSSFLEGVGTHPTIGLINVGAVEASGWRTAYGAVDVPFERVSAVVEWKDIFPEWIDEEEEGEGGPTCPEIPMPAELGRYDEMDVVAVAIPCRYPEEGWARDVLRLQVHLVAAEVAVRRGRRDMEGKVRVLVRSTCRPMMEIFRCEDLVRREGDWWLFKADVRRLETKVRLPVGSCKLALPLWKEEIINEISDHTEFHHAAAAAAAAAAPASREAYATVIHSSDKYVCGAILLAQSLLKSFTTTTRDLLLLHDASIPPPKLAALAAAGWKLHRIRRIRNPHAEKGTYNEYNYSKLRLWQLTAYSKIVFVDADVVVLRNLDVLFHFPQLSATGNDGVVFNSGVMVVEPSACMFRWLVSRRRDVFSYNGGDQGFLNENFVWWHRLPRRVNFLKNFWANTSAEAALKNRLFGADPPELYSIHYLGIKPWNCYRDYDCNWDIGDQRVYASDVAHQRWWMMHDEMDDKLKPFCRLSERRKVELRWDRKKAEEAGFSDEHWKINVTDPRRFEN